MTRFNVNLAEQSGSEPAEMIEQDSLVILHEGHSFDLNKVGIKKHVPNTSSFNIYEFFCVTSKKPQKLLHCSFNECGKIFRKWHNFFDHLRIHTNERPYCCHYEGCEYKFTQKANLNKHIEIHEGRKRFTCSQCS